MLKRLLATIAFAVLSSIASANSAPYLGVGTGINVNSGNHDDINSYRGMPLNVFAGFGGTLTDNFYLAGELFGTVVNGELSGTTSLRSTYSYGAAILPGCVLSDQTLTYLRAGVLQSHFTTAGGDTITGGQLGLGAQFSATQHLDLRGEYNYVFYRALHAHSYAGELVSVSPRSDQFNLALVYKFN